MNRRWIVALAAVLAVLVAFDAAARPGGGQGYSGSSRSSGGGGGGGGGGDGLGLIVELLIRLIFAYPQIGVPVALIVIAVWWWHSRHVSDVGSDRWSSDGGHSEPAPARPRSVGLMKIRERDPEFSAVLFEDFVYALYARVHAARSAPREMAKLAPYVAEGSRAALMAREPKGAAVSGVVIGAMRVVGVRAPDRGPTLVELEIVANYTGGSQGYYVRELWTLTRAAGVVSKPPPGPGEAYTFHCPSCGAPFESADGHVCRFCGQEVGEGRFDWSVTHVRLVEQETRPPALTADVVERGTDAPTVFDPQIQSEHMALISEDPGAAPQHIERRMRAIYAALNAGWTSLELRRVRPFVSDALFNYLNYWIAAYRAQGLRNVLEQMEISKLQFVKLVRDRHYDAITIRFWASGLDYTVRADGTRVSGSKSKKRGYSEYWTLIRGSAVRGAPKAAGVCPSCGAPLDRVSNAGACEYCGSHLTRGEFDWVLSKIEQDDDYAG